MSAYIVDKAHILFLVNAAMSRRLNMAGGSFRWNAAEPGEPYFSASLACNDYEKAANVANMLWRENIKSVSYRYPNESSATLPGPIGENFDIKASDFHSSPPEIDHIQVIKSCDCLEYQSCEHEGWTKSESHAFLQSLRKQAWQHMDGYEEAAWGGPEKKRKARATA